MIWFFIWFGPDHQLLTTNQLDLNPQPFWIIAHILYMLGGYVLVGRQYGNSPPCRSVRSLRKSESLSGQISESEMVLFSQVLVQITISALVEYRRLIGSAFFLTSHLQFVNITVSFWVCRRLGLDVRVLATGDDIAIGSPIILSAMIDELG